MTEVTLEGETVWHVLEALAPGASVEGLVDWARPRSHAAAHGAPILSRAFVEVARADTRSFHLGEAVVTIDVDRGPDADLLRRRRDRATVVWEDRPVRTHVVPPERAIEFPLRKPRRGRGSAGGRGGGVRLVGLRGTHVARSGQVGVIAILGTERYKGGTRVAFACGAALGRLRETSDLLRGLCLEFTSGEADLPRAIARLRSEARALESLRPLLAESLDREADALLEAAERGAAGPVVARYFPDRDPAELAGLAARVAGRGGIAILAAGTARTTSRGRTRLRKVQYRQAPSSPTSPARAGRRGGRPEAAQGAIPAERAAEAIDAARRAALPERTRYGSHHDGTSRSAPRGPLMLRPDGGRRALRGRAEPGRAQAGLGQSFGQNKVQYKRFDWKVLRTEHFDVYHYRGPSAPCRTPPSWPSAVISG